MKRCGRCHKGGGSLGPILIALGLGLFLAYIIPYQVLITLIGCCLVCLGIRCIFKK